MAKRIITISREFGSGGRFIGEEVAKKLGIAYYDKGYHRSDCREVRIFYGVHKGKCGTLSKEGFVWLCFCRTRPYRKIRGRYGVRSARKVILEIAEKESCVIIGRNADFILKDREDVLNVFIHGDMPEKVQRICKAVPCHRSRSSKMMADIDKDV